MSSIPERELFALTRVENKAKEILVRRHLGLVHFIARRYWGLPREDIFQEGCVGLLYAIDRFEPDLGYRFSTYAAWWIRQAINQALQKNSRLIYLPAHLYLERVRFEGEAASFKCRYGREPTEEEISRMLGWSRSRASKIARLPSACHPGEDPEDYPAAGETADEVLAEEERARVCAPLEELTDYQRRIVERKYGFFGVGPMTLREMAAEEGVSREAVRKAQKSAEKRIRRLLLKEGLLMGGEGL